MVLTVDSFSSNVHLHNSWNSAEQRSWLQIIQLSKVWSEFAFTFTTPEHALMKYGVAEHSAHLLRGSHGSVRHFRFPLVPALVLIPPTSQFSRYAVKCGVLYTRS